MASSGTVPVGGVNVFEEPETKDDGEIEERMEYSSDEMGLANQQSDEDEEDPSQQSAEGKECGTDQELDRMGDSGVDAQDLRCQNHSSSTGMAVSNDPEMLPSSTNAIPLIPNYSISADILQESSSGDPIHPTRNTATDESTSPSQPMANDLLSYMLWTAFCIIEVLQNGFCQVYSCENDLPDPLRQCATMADDTTDHRNVSSVTNYEIHEEGIRRRADVQFTNDTMRCEAQPGSDEEDQSLSNNFQPTSVNGTSNEESYMDIMLRQKRSHSPINHQDVNRISSNNWMTRSTDMGPDSDEATSSEGEELQSNTRPPESRPQGVPHGGWLDPLTRLYNTCNLDQLVNGQYLICLFRPIRNLLEDRAQRFPETYGHLWHALRLCEAGQFAAAKFYLAPLYDMYSAEGTRVMPLIVGQLRHFFSTSCQKCGYCHDGVPIANICLNEYNRIGGFQEALRAAFSRPDGTCIQQGYVIFCIIFKLVQLSGLFFTTLGMGPMALGLGKMHGNR
ncbi:uncharacterized protein LOC117326319 [Pecten maximus]|uniref:uncharacterized protein LOC117326319 n=1 Tax=Pecten maximus TaxID=6579 RepID=UPI001459075F|nr:uncharacterized protein LOC117326319 [Pecten maximus]XP_033738908.1 uncharacterized protein LOC117326319 [Pecten maximus]XP_033738909.1 uncharacterized protein LOC117326319 [Pecten maximus]